MRGSERSSLLPRLTYLFRTLGSVVAAVAALAYRQRRPASAREPGWILTPARWRSRDCGRRARPPQREREDGYIKPCQRAVAV